MKECLWPSPSNAPAYETIKMARSCLDILRRRRLPPTRMFIRKNTICMYFWDHKNYADLEFAKDYITLAMNLQGEAAGLCLLERWGVENSEDGIQHAVRMILKNVDRTALAIDKRDALE